MMLVVAGCAFAQTRSMLRPAGRCARPSIRVDKSDGVLELRCGGVAHARFEATFGAEPAGPKLREGDERTPEGRYRVSSRVETARFHRFLGVSYPNEADRERARRAGVTRVGGGIGIHGVNRGRSWLAHAWIRVAHDTGLAQVWGPTDGCIALDNDDVAYLYERVSVGTPVEIVP
jgi:murein L,D-transpeptidase YafK